MLYCVPFCYYISIKVTSKHDEAKGNTGNIRELVVNNLKLRFRSICNNILKVTLFIKNI